MIMLKYMLRKIESEPKWLFLVDGLGAMLSSIFLGVVLVKFETFIGIPSSTLYFLAVIPIFFMIYDYTSFRNNRSKTEWLLKGIAIFNLLYCCLLIGFGFYHSDTITIFGITYIILEVLVVVSLAIWEFRSAQNKRKPEVNRL